MADREVESAVDEVPEFDETLEAVLLAAIEEASKKLEAGEEVVPFTALAVGETLFIETHPGEDVDECFKAAERTVSHAVGASAYALCYDGYVSTDAGERDALIAEGGVPGELQGYAVACLYDMPEEEGAPVVIDEEVAYIGPAPNYMAFAVSMPSGEEDGEEAQDEVESESAE